MPKAPAFFAAAAALAVSGTSVQAQSATELLEAGDVPFAQWTLPEAAPAEIGAAMEQCIAVVTGPESGEELASLLARDGWEVQPMPEGIAPFMAQVADERWDDRRSDYDSKAAFQEDRAADPYYDPALWPQIYTHPDLPTMLSISQSWRGPTCQVLTDPVETDGSKETTIQLAVETVSAELGEGRFRTPHGFAWETDEIGIGLDYGNGMGGLYRMFPPVFNHFVPYITVLDRRGD
ncbi:hypothetical protein [Aurantiacibacter gilvus]|uniref:Uncharacterized protein n=1 Tax=Aurantiacibacter gilvus TaxID=3139141 RepID=A0ABU9IE43_9SPHN